VILTGTADRVGRPEAQAYRLQRSIPHARLVRLKKTGGMLHHQAPVAVLDAIRRVRKRHTRLPRALAALVNAMRQLLV